MNMKYAWIGGLCLLSAMWLAWISPPEGVAGLVRKAAKEERTEFSRTKVRERDDEERREAGSLAEEYLMKAKRGMTEDEVRWVLEDFVALGLDVEYPEDKSAEGYLALRKAREDWYLGALVSGLRLTKDQEMQARERMGLLRERDYTEFVEYLNGLESFQHEGKEMKVFDGGKARELMDTDRWLYDEGYLPWKLCELSENQLAVTRFRSNDAEAFKDWLVGAAGKEGDPVQPKLPDELAHHGVNMYALGLTGFGAVDSFFPLSTSQVEMLIGEKRVATDQYFLESAQVLQPEQLKMYLLFHPQVAEALSRESGEKVE